MQERQSQNKITDEHRSRKALVYLRQSSSRQVEHNLESQRLQYAMVDRAKALGFQVVETIDSDLGLSASIGARERGGFDKLISAVARGEVGIVLSREVSRLSRTDKDWCHLLEVCQIFGTLIGDEQQVYDLSMLDDQLVLGIKGTMSVVELNVLKMRLIRGQEEKARRGELIKRLPSGYVVDGDGKIVKSPDERIREAIELVFQKFRELWSVRQTFKWFRGHDMVLPVNTAQGGKGITWRVPTQSFIRDVLGNPFYAGAYVYGRRQQETVFENGKLLKRMGSLRQAEECRVFIRDHHEGYISWEIFEENRKIIRGNSMTTDSRESVSAVRSGQGLLTGLVRCGHCGRKLHVRYWGKSGTSARYLCKGEFDAGGDYCLGFGGTVVDRRFGEEILKAISPLGIEASLKAIEELSTGENECRNSFQRQLEQLTYEAHRAFEQYDEVDPRNRLVAAELERRWNAKLDEVEKVRARLSELDGQTTQLSSTERERILQMGEQFEHVWRSKNCPGELKKKIARTIIKEVIADEPQENVLHFIIHWVGGVHTELAMEKPQSSTMHKTSIESLEVVRKMAPRYGDDQIASVLNQLGQRTGKGKRWNQTRVKTARRNHSIGGQKRSTPDSEILSLTAAAKHCGVSNKTIEKLAHVGILKVEQVVPRAPWEIRRVDLEAQPVASILEHLRNTGKLVIDGGSSNLQMSLLTDNTGDDNARYHE